MGIVLADDGLVGQRALAGVDVLDDVFAQLASVRLVVLSGCFNADQASAIARHVDVVVGTTRDITAEAASAFAGEFYAQLAYGRSVGGAFDIARGMVAGAAGGGRDACVLVSRTGTDARAVMVCAPSVGGLPADDGDSVALLRAIAARVPATAAHDIGTPVWQGRAHVQLPETTAAWRAVWCRLGTTALVAHCDDADADSADHGGGGSDAPLLVLPLHRDAHCPWVLEPGDGGAFVARMYEPVQGPVPLRELCALAFRTAAARDVFMQRLLARRVRARERDRASSRRAAPRARPHLTSARTQAVGADVPCGA
jgi:hypothetical protein